MSEIIVLFGAGRNGKSIVDKHAFIGSEVLFCDNDSKKHNTLYGETRIISFNELLELYVADRVKKIILTMADERESLHQCLSAGIKMNDLYCWNEKTNTPRSINEKYMETVYSQDGEEIFLRELFRHKNKGTYIDIGANHPFRFSNTYWAYSKGWRGINIEPDIINYELLQEVRKGDINLNCGISDEETQLDYYMFKENALNTFCSDEIGNMNDVKEIRKVSVRRLDSILREYDIWKIDFIDIDVEGMELKVLDSIPWDEADIRCILVEQKNMSLQEVMESEVYKRLNAWGYIPVNKYNRTVIYIKTD